MVKNRKFQIAFLLLFFLSMFIRLALVGINRDANDPHVDVADRILRFHSLPIKTDCWECSQPKLFHLTFAIGIKVLGLADSLPYRQNVAGEIINFFASAVLLVFVWKFIKRLPVHQNRLQLIAFALVALNPALIGINSQATNDTFAILFSTLAIYYAFDFLQKEDVRTFLLVILFVVLGISSKTDAWVTMIAIVLAFFIKTWVQKYQRGKTVAFAIAFICAVMVLCVANPLDQVLTNYKEFGSPFVNNKPTQPLPHLFEQTYAGKPGIVSIQDGFFTFKFTELLKHPRIETGAAVYPPFRTSLWSLLYGRTYSIHFDNWPPSWSTSGDGLFVLTRGLFILGLLPTLLVLGGAVIELTLAFKTIIKRDSTIAKATQFGLFALVFIGYLAFITLYALEYRDYFSLKVIFIYPALLSVIVVFLRSTDKVYQFLENRNRWFIRIFETIIGMLLVLYLVDVAALIFQLAQNSLRAHGV